MNALAVGMVRLVACGMPKHHHRVLPPVRGTGIFMACGFAAMAVTMPVVLAQAAREPASVAADRAALLRGVDAISAPGAPGGVTVFGPDAFAVVAGHHGRQARMAVVAAGRWEKGRVVAFGHNGYPGDFSSVGTGRLLVNAARWAAGEKKTPKIGVLKQDGLAGHFTASGLVAEALNPKDWSKQLAGFDVVVTDAHALRADDVAPLSEFIRNGGGWLGAATGWGWLYGGKDEALLSMEFAGNKVLLNAGLAWNAGMLGTTAGDGYAAVGGLALLNAGVALENVLAAARGGGKMAKEDAVQCEATLADAVRSLPPDDEVFLPKLAAVCGPAASTGFPTPENPLGTENVLGRVAVSRELMAMRAMPAAQVRAHPAAAAFPGAVPAEARRVSGRMLAVDMAVPGWHGTGLYAAPGEAVVVVVPAGAENAGLVVRIGCHNDSLWHHDTWRRAPEICRREEIRGRETRVANAFGGLVYIEVPAGKAAVVHAITLSGAVEAPRFVLGSTSLEDWRNTVRHAPAPWAELETSKVVLSVPSAKIRGLDDPAALMEFWDKILDAEADLAAIPRERDRPERIVPDVQIGGGYMHSGYPIMTHLDGAVDLSLSLPDMRAKGSWGHFHELGHNHQSGDWTFAGTGEVTCNWFSLYVMESLCGQAPGGGHDAMEPGLAESRLRRYLEGGKDFQQWKADPFLALTMYHQLRIGFGWETYKKVIAEYRTLPADARPRDDDAKRDQWMVRFSRHAGRNLGPFFAAWGVPLSQAARDAVRDLPVWMPDGFPRT